MKDLIKDFNFKASDVAKHSAAHVLATAVKRIFPSARIGIGPVTKSGFYYDFETEREITEDDLPLIEKNIQQILQENLTFQKVMLSKQEAENLLLQIGQIYKAELVKTIPDSQLSFYKLGDEFIDLCRGPHVKSTNQIGIIKLVGIEESHWNDDPSRPKMTRINGVVFQNIVEFNEFEEAIKSTEARDFVKVSEKYNLMFRHLKNELYYADRGAKIVENIRKKIEKEFADLLPNNLYFGQQVEFETLSKLIDKNFGARNHSYKEFPRVYRADFVKKFKIGKTTLDNYCITYKIYSDISRSTMSMGDVLEKILDVSSFFSKEDVNVEIKSNDIEHNHVKFISNLLQKKIISHNKILSSSVGKNIVIEFKTTDSIGKTWTLCSMIINPNSSVEFYSPKNIKEKSIEFSFFFEIASIYAYLIEENGLELPFDLKPVQIYCIPKANKQFEYSTGIASNLQRYGFNAYNDLRSKSLKAKIRDAENLKSAFIFIIGKKEELNNAVSVRQNQLEVGLVSLDNLINFINENKIKS